MRQSPIGREALLQHVLCVKSDKPLLAAALEGEATNSPQAACSPEDGSSSEAWCLSRCRSPSVRRQGKMSADGEGRQPSRHVKLLSLDKRCQTSAASPAAKTPEERSRFFPPRGRSGSTRLSDYCYRKRPSRRSLGQWILAGVWLCVSGGYIWAHAQTEDSNPRREASTDCSLMDSRCLLNYTVDSPDFFYHRRHQALAAPTIAPALLLQEEQQPGVSLRGEGEEANGGVNDEVVLTESDVFHFAVRRLQSMGAGGSSSGGGGLFSPPRQGEGGGGGSRRRHQQTQQLTLDLGDPLDPAAARPARPLLESNGLICEDDERVEDFGVKCRLIARSLGGRLGCEKRLIDISPDGRLPANIPAFSRVADACPMTCGLCEECAPGCALWFLGNTLCDAVCNNAACQFDGGDCWSADCVVGPWTEWSACSVTCGGPGTERRRREVKSRAKQGGTPCPKLEPVRLLDVFLQSEFTILSLTRLQRFIVHNARISLCLDQALQRPHNTDEMVGKDAPSCANRVCRRRVRGAIPTCLAQHTAKSANGESGRAALRAVGLALA
ncbi:thrombospondin type 1 domain-containing protein [Cyclospora cayetanensis]|uniref:Thrombospondin type 1 domain-containing protein n=1 Tax=Cyclospora cayetanensis TaxID=88456 RepID=A0A1D3D1Q7_9EIME|nr:thrombospondin type 1 domain-containing protein [Cyclospora cayetanensis]